jgi:gliding motility-associated-like protein
VSINPTTVTICEGASTTLTATGGPAYLWSNSATSAVITISPNLTSNYSVTVTDANNCTASAAAAVTVIPTMVLAPVVTDISCNGSSDGAIQLGVSSGQSPYTFLWNTNSTVQNPAGLAAGNYSVTVTDNAGCTATTTATVIEPAPLVLDSSFNNPICANLNNNGAIALTITGGTIPYQYNWSTGDVMSSLLNLAPGNYTVTVTDEHNCSVSASFTLAYIYDFSVQTTTAATIKLGESANIGYTLNGNAGNYVSVWSPSASLSCVDCVSPVAAPNVTTLYQVEIKNDSGCVATDTVTVYVIPDYAVFVPTAFTPNNDGNNDVFKMYGNIQSIAFLDIQVYNRIGEKVFESQDHNFEWDGTFRGVLQNSSVYTWQMKLTFMDGHREELRKGTVTLIR